MIIFNLSASAKQESGLLKQATISDSHCVTNITKFIGNFQRLRLVMMITRNLRVIIIAHTECRSFSFIKFENVQNMPDVLRAKL